MRLIFFDNLCAALFSKKGLSMKKLFFILSLSGLVFAAEKPVTSKYLRKLLSFDNDDFLQMLKVSPISVDLTDEAGNTLLFLAIYEGLDEKLNILLNGQLLRQPKTDIANKSGISPLHYAALRANVYATKELIRRNADIKRTDESGRTPLHCLLKCDEKASEIVKVGEMIIGGEYLNKYDYSLLTAESKTQETPIDLALKYNNMPAICLFYELCNRSTYGQPCPAEEIKKTIKTKILAYLKRDDHISELISFSTSSLREWNKEKEKMNGALDRKEQELKAFKNPAKP